MMKVINKTDTRIERTGYGTAALVMGAVFTIVGGYFALAGFGLIPLHGKANAPLWVIGSIGVAFALPGLLLLSSSLRGLYHQKRAQRLRVSEPARPWLADYPWQSTGVSDPVIERWIKQLVGMVLFAGMTAPFNWWGFASGEGSLPIQIFAGLLDLAWIGLSLVVAYRALQFLKYGTSRLAFGHFPFAPGETLTVRFSPNRFGKLGATLRFIEERFETTGSGKNRSVSLRVYELYSEKKTITAEAELPEVTIRFDLPEDQEWVTQLTADPGVRYWELLVESDQPGIDFRTTFPLPVYGRASPAVVNPARHDLTAVAALRRIPYAFELGLPLVLLAGAGLLWLLAPQLVLQGVDIGRGAVARVQAFFLLEPIEDVGTNAMAAATGPDGRVWVLTKYSLDRFVGEDRVRLLDNALYRRLFDHKVNALSALLVTGADEAWVGSWYGELFHYVDGRWTEVSSRDEPLGSRIHDLAWFDGQLYLGTRKGLWRLEAEGLSAVDEAPSGEIEVLSAAVDRTLCAGSNQAIVCTAGDAWDELWQAPATITFLTPTADDGWMVGTNDGLWSLDADGQATEQILAGYQVKAVAEHEGQLWVATWNAGLLAGGEDGWLQLETESLSDLVVDESGTLWLASYGGGLMVAPVDSIRLLMRDASLPTGE